MRLHHHYHILNDSKIENTFSWLSLKEIRDEKRERESEIISIKVKIIESKWKEGKHDENHVESNEQVRLEQQQ